MRGSFAGVVRDLRSHAGAARERGRSSTKTKMSGHPWMSADSCIFMGVHGHLWISISILIAIHGIPWILMDMHGYPWIPDAAIEQGLPSRPNQAKPGAIGQGLLSRLMIAFLMILEPAAPSPPIPKL